jgi:hypothetical protein
MRVVEEIGESEAQTPTSSIMRNTVGMKSRSSESALAVVREAVVWTSDSDRHT